MPTKREASCYKKLPNHFYTRKEYIKSVPQSKIRHYNIGNQNGDYHYKVLIVADQQGLVLARALEAMRITMNRHLTESIGRGNFFLRIRPVPHHIVRERKFLGMAGADRIQKGMRRAYGKPSDRAAAVYINDIIVEIWVQDKHLDQAKEAARLALYKLGLDAHIEIQRFRR